MPSSDQQSGLFRALQSLQEDIRRIEINRHQEPINTIRDSLCKLAQSLQKHQVRAESGADTALQTHALLANMRRSAAESSQVHAELQVLRHLRFREIQQRYEQISPAHVKTFEWIFQDIVKLQHHDFPVGFRTWLEQGCGHFWLEGKAGSGKSTLMRFICRHERTRSCLSTWAAAANKKLVTADFFFYHFGAPLQKSQEGLLRALLFGILRKCPDLIKIVCSKRFLDAGQDLDDWTRDELFEVFQALSTQDLSTRFCFFIDGLDEYDGDHDELIQMLKSLFSSTASPDIKVCLSSRPWQQFRDAFGQVPGQTLRLQDLTYDDIGHYVKAEFMKNEEFCKIAEKEPKYLELIKNVQQGAAGVFLWVSLVVRELLGGIRAGDNVSQIQHRLTLLPEDLEAFFKHMLKQVNRAYKRRSVEAFQMALASPEPPVLVLYSITDALENNEEWVHTTTGPSKTDDELVEMGTTMQRQLDVRCRGLLEIAADDKQGSVLFRGRILFLHRSVGEFLNSKEMQGLLNKELDDGYNANLALCRAIVIALNMAAVKKSTWSAEDALVGNDLLEQLFYHARELETRHPGSDMVTQAHGLLNQAESVLQRSDWKWKRKRRAFINRAIEWDLHAYVEGRIKSQPNLLNRSPERPLLDAALQPDSVPYLHAILRSFDMVSLLLEWHANPNERYKDFTVWARFLAPIVTDRSLADQAEVVDIARELVRHGADLKTLVAWETKKTKVGREKTGRASDLFKPTHPRTVTDIYTRRAEEIIPELFGVDRCALIFNAQPPEQPWYLWLLGFRR